MLNSKEPLMELASVNTALPEEYRYNNKTIQTSIFKKPVEGRVWVSAEGLSGDKQADLKCHGGEHKAVYAFSLGEYEYWKPHLADSVMRAGYFGENLSIQGANLEQLYIGDRLRIGNCVMEITQPRVPCFKLALRAGNKALPKHFIDRAKTGFYLRVIKAGVIEKGQPIELMEGHRDGLSVEAVFKAFFEKGFPDRVKINTLALCIDALSEEWKAMIRKIV